MKNHVLAVAASLLAGAFGSWCQSAPPPGQGQPQERITLRGHGDIVYCVAFRPDGKILASAGNGDETVRLWDVAKGECIGVLSVRPPEEMDPRKWLVETLAFSPDGKTLAADYCQKGVLLWDVASRKRIAVLDHPLGNPEALKFTPDGKTLMTRVGHTIWYWDLPSRKIRDTLQVDKGFVAEWEYGPNGKLLLVAHSYTSPSFSLWDPQAGKPAVTYEGHERGVAFVVFAPDGKTLASYGFDRTVRLWDLATGKNTATIKLPGTGGVPAFSPDGKTVAASYSGEAPVDLDAPGFVCLIDVPTGKVVATLKGHTGPVFSLAFSPDGRLLATGSADKTIKLWSLPAEYSGGK